MYTGEDLTVLSESEAEQQASVLGTGSEAGCLARHSRGKLFEASPSLEQSFVRAYRIPVLGYV